MCPLNLCPLNLKNVLARNYYKSNGNISRKKGK